MAFGGGLIWLVRIIGSRALAKEAMGFGDVTLRSEERRVGKECRIGCRCGWAPDHGKEKRRFKEGERVVVYHISGCGVCNDCRRGDMISCTSDTYRRVFFFQAEDGIRDF